MTSNRLLNDAFGVGRPLHLISMSVALVKSHS